MNSKLRGVFVAAATAILFVGASQVSAQQVTQFDLPAQPLADALRAVSKMTDTNILMNLELDRRPQGARDQGDDDGGGGAE